MRGGGQGIELLRIRLLGSPEASFGGQGLRFGRKKALALLCYPAAEGGKRHRRDLAELSWPRLEEGGTSGHGLGEEIEP